MNGAPPLRYRPGDPVGPLAPWPFEAPESAYRIVSGAPRASGRLDHGGPGCDTRTGIWRCTEGVFECTEQGFELMTVLSGDCRLTDLGTGVALDLRAGDTAFIEDGARMRWEIRETVTKVFFGQKPGGY